MSEIPSWAIWVYVAGCITSLFLYGMMIGKNGFKLFDEAMPMCVGALLWPAIIVVCIAALVLTCIVVVPGFIGKCILELGAYVAKNLERPKKEGNSSR